MKIEVRNRISYKERFEKEEIELKAKIIELFGDKKLNKIMIIIE